MEKVKRVFTFFLYPIFYRQMLNCWNKCLASNAGRLLSLALHRGQ